MTEAYRRLTIGALLALCLVSAARADAAEARYAGRPVVDVLLELRAPGVDFIYSSELVPESMRVLAEPQAAGSLPIAREILAAHGLSLSAVRPGLYAVTRQMSPPTDVGYNAPEPETAEPPTRLAEVVVSTSRYAFDRSGTFSSVSIAGDTLASQPVLGEDAIRALGRLPGIAQSGISAQSSVRGGESGEVLMLLDGFPLRQAFHMPGYQSVFGVLDPGLVADAEIFTGGFPVRYGNRMGGVFDVQTIEADHEPRTALGLSVFNALARRGGRVEAADVGWLTAGRVGTLKPFIEAFAHDAGSPSYADMYARATHGDPDRVRISANLLWSRDELSIRREEQDEEAEIESRNRYLWLRADRDWDSGVRASLWLGFSSIDSFRAGTVDNPGIASGFVTDRRSSDYREARGRITWQPHARHWIESGFEWTGEDARYRYAAEATYAEAVAELFSRDVDLARASALSPERERIALFAAHRWQISPVLISELGLRAQRTVTTGTIAEDWNLDPRVNLHWRMGPATDLRVHWGRFHQTDEVHELKIEDGLTSFPEAQRSDQVIVGIDHRLPSGLALRLEGFRKSQSDPRPHFENLLDPLSLVPEIAPDRVRIAPTSAEIRGAELSLVAERRHLTWWAGATWSEAYDRVDAERVPRSWDQTWAVSAGFDWTRGNWRFGVAAGAHEGWPTTRVEETQLGERNAARFKLRGTVDLRAEYRKPLALGSLAVTFEVTNAINIGNACCAELRANTDDEGNVIFSTRRSDWLPIVPSIGVLWEF